MQDATIQDLALIVSRYYHAPDIEQREVERTEVVQRRVRGQKTVVDSETIDAGPHPGGYAVLALAIVCGGGIALSSSVVAGLIILGVGVTGGAVLLSQWRQMEEKTVKRTKEVPKTIKEEVTRTETVDEEVYSTTKIKRIGRGTLDFEATETPEGVLVKGPETINTERKLAFPTLDQPEEVYRATQRVEEEVESIPWVLDGPVSVYESAEGGPDTGYEDAVPLRGEERVLRDYFEMTESLFSSIQKPVIHVSALNSPDLFADLVPLMDRIGDAADRSSAVATYLDGPAGTRLEDFAREWESKWTRVNLALFQVRHDSLFEHVGPDCYELGTQLNYGAFNFYCPFCNEQQQEELLDRDYDVHEADVHDPIRYSDNTQCVFLPSREVWQCKTCERETKEPIPIHRMLDDVLFPAYDHLMQENKNERLRIHAKAREKERDLQEKAESETDRIRHRHMSKIFELSEEMERIQADIAGERDAIASMEDLLTSYEDAQSGAVENIDRFSDEIHEEIQARTKRVLRNVDAVKEREMEALDREMTELSKAQRIEDERRDAIQRQIAEGMWQQVQEQRRTTAAVDRNTEVTQEGFNRTVEAVNRNTEVTEEGFKETVESVEANTAATRDQTSKLEEKMDQGLAQQKAFARKQGIDTDDYSTLTNLGRAGRDTMTEMKGTLLGRSSEQVEREKLDNV